MQQSISTPCDACGGTGHIVMTQEVDDPGRDWRNLHDCTDPDVVFVWGHDGDTVTCAVCGESQVIAAEDQAR